MGVFWDQVRERLQCLFDRHPELVLWAFEQGPQTENPEGYEILEGQVHKMVHAQPDSLVKEKQLHRLISHYRSTDRIQQAVTEAELLHDDQLDAWLDAMVLMHQFMPSNGDNDELFLFDRIHEFKQSKREEMGMETKSDRRDDEEVRLWIARMGINPWIEERFGLDRIILHRFRDSMGSAKLIVSLKRLFEGLPHRARLSPSFNRPTVNLSGFRRHIERLATDAVESWLQKSHLMDYQNDFTELIESKFDNQHRPIRTRIWRRIDTETQHLRKVDALLALHRIDANAAIQREIFKLFEEIGEEYTGEDRCVEMIRHFSSPEIIPPKMGPSVIPLGIRSWKIFKDVRWLCSDDVNPEHAFIRHKLGLPIRKI